MNTHFIPSIPAARRHHLFAEMKGDGEKLQCIRCSHTRHVAIADLTACTASLEGSMAMLPRLPLLDEAA